MEIASPEPLFSVVRVAPDRDAAESVSLVLHSQGIEHGFRRTDAGVEVIVAGHDEARALATLALQEKDVADLAAAAGEPPAPDHGGTFAGIALGVALLCFFLFTGGRGIASGQRWFDAGSALAGAIKAGALWRLVTALTLHADIAHVAGNAVAGFIFVSAVGRWLGAGWALLLTLAAGALGNLATAALTISQHNSIGSSTAMFGALGVLVGLQVRRRLRARDPVRGRWARVVPVLAACLGVFAMLGVGGQVDLPPGKVGPPAGHVDVLAHLFGMLAGLGLGLLASRLRAPGRLANAGLVLTSVAVVVGCWWWALRVAVLPG